MSVAEPDPADVLLVNPTDVDLPLVKAVAAENGIDVVASRNVPAGHMYRAAGYLRLPRWTVGEA